MLNIFFREYYLTLSNNSRMEDKILGTMTVLREILHQWFGNMVTTPQWDYVWLNEGISKYLNYFILDMVSLNQLGGGGMKINFRKFSK